MQPSARATTLALVALGAIGPAAAVAEPARGLTIAEARALAFTRNRDVIAARLAVDAAEVERAAAAVLPNPELSYSAGNFIAGAGNPQGIGLRPRPFDQVVHTLAVSAVLDVWAKRSARLRAAAGGVEEARLRLADALRAVGHAVATAFVDLLRQQAEAGLARETRERHDETVRLSQARRAAGEISDNELRKVELEAVRYRTSEIEAHLAVELAQQRLAALLALPPSGPALAPPVEPPLAGTPLDLPSLVTHALRDRADLKAARAAVQRAGLALASERRAALPDPSVGLAYTRSNFQVSGDNPHTFGVTVAVPVPIFDRNQGGVGRAAVAGRGADNDLARLTLEVEHEVTAAVRRAERAGALVAVYEGGTLARADASLRAAETAYRAGAVSLLELLEAERANLDLRARYLAARYEQMQARFDVANAVGGALE